MSSSPTAPSIKTLIDDPAGKWLDEPLGTDHRARRVSASSAVIYSSATTAGTTGSMPYCDPMHGHFKGMLTLASGQPFSENNLWALSFGNGGGAGSTNTLFFTAGPGGTDGLFGSLQAIPSLSAKAPIVPNLPNGAFQTLTTIPANGDLNPYGVAFVPPGFPTGGTLNPGDILVSNFNSSPNNQNGTGTTIVDISPNGGESLFFQSPSTPDQIGLDTALGILKSGFVIVGNVPATYDSRRQLGVRRPGIAPDPRPHRQRRRPRSAIPRSSTAPGT